MDSFYDKLSEILNQIKIFDEKILEILAEPNEINEETLSQDDKNLEIEVTFKRLKTIKKKSKKGKSEAVSKKMKKKGGGFTKFPKLEIKWFSGDQFKF